MSNNFDIKRRVSLVIDIHADSKQDLLSFLTSIMIDIERCAEDEPWNMVSGGYSLGGTAKIKIDKDMTGDKYRELLEEWRTSKVV